ncbi:hypothetical protein VTN96DRAFT_4943 [Rasamsonia emersonii]
MRSTFSLISGSCLSQADASRPKERTREEVQSSPFGWTLRKGPERLANQHRERGSCPERTALEPSPAKRALRIGQRALQRRDGRQRDTTVPSKLSSVGAPDLVEWFPGSCLMPARFVILACPRLFQRKIPSSLGPKSSRQAKTPGMGGCVDSWRCVDSPSALGPVIQIDNGRFFNPALLRVPGAA